MEKKNKEMKVSRSLALQEFTVFLKKWKSKEFKRGKLTSEIIEEQYIDVIEAIEEGNLIFENGSPVYTLKAPIFSESKNDENIVATVKFRSRIKKADLTRVMDNLDIEKQKGTYVLKLIGYITQLSKPEYDRLENDDFDVLNQICSVF